MLVSQASYFMFASRLAERKVWGSRKHRHLYPVCHVPMSDTVFTTSLSQGEGEEEEADEMVNQVLDEIGIGSLTEVRRLGWLGGWRQLAVGGWVGSSVGSWLDGRPRWLGDAMRVLLSPNQRLQHTAQPACSLLSVWPQLNVTCLPPFDQTSLRDTQPPS